MNAAIPPRRANGGRARILIVGGGITGLAAAHRLRERLGDAAEIVIAERAMRLGGKIHTVDLAGRPIEAGAESILAARPEAVGLAESVGLGGDLVHPTGLTPALSLDGRLRDFPTGTMMGIPADPADVAAIADVKERADSGGPILAPGADMSVGELVRTHLGSEILDRLVSPMLAGVYAGDVDRLSVAAVMPGLAEALRRHSSLTEAVAEVKRPSEGRTRAKERVFATIDGGLGRLITATSAASRADVRLGMTVRELRQTPYGWEVIAGPVPDPMRIEADAVLLAVPSSPAARLLRNVEPEAAAALSGVAYASVALASFAFEDIDLPEHSGFLTPAGNGKSVKAATFTSRKWPHLGRRRTFLRVSMGRLGEEALLQYDDADLIKTALRELGEHLGQRVPEPVAQRVDRWGGALPQYAPGHTERFRAAREKLRARPGIAIAGAAVDGVGIAACIASGQAAAAEIIAQLAPESD